MQSRSPHVDGQSVQRDALGCLDEYPRYVRLLRRQALARKYGYVAALAPFGIVVFVVESFFRQSHSKLVDLAVLVTLAWTLAVVAYGMGLTIYWAAFRCPRCKRRFGTDDDECWSCGLPRHRR